ncbi:Lipoprotein LipO precursor [compost metagenome]
MDGKIYGIPRPNDPHDALFPAIRQDWLNVLGLVQPQTMEEVYEVLKLFVTHDPDGNGKHDTIGMAGYIHAAGLGSLSWVEHAYTGSPERFSIQDGRVIDHAVSAEEELALKWLTRAYAEGLIDKEFPVSSQEQVQHKISSNQVGLAALNVGNAASLSSEAAEWVPLARLKANSTATAVAPWNTRGSGMYIISTMSRHEPKLLLEWLDRGIAMTENEEWDDMDGFEPADYSAIRNLFGQADLLDSPAISELPAVLQTAYQSAVKEWRNVSYSDQSIAEINSIWSTGKYAELNSRLEQFKIKVILGAATLEDWKQFTKELVTTDEYKDMMSELNKLAAGSSQ